MFSYGQGRLQSEEAHFEIALKSLIELGDIQKKSTEVL